jgi:hypothetical protein
VLLVMVVQTVLLVPLVARVLLLVPLVAHVIVVVVVLLVVLLVVVLLAVLVLVVLLLVVLLLVVVLLVVVLLVVLVVLVVAHLGQCIHLSPHFSFFPPLHCTLTGLQGHCLWHVSALSIILRNEPQICLSYSRHHVMEQSVVVSFLVYLSTHPY